MAREYNSLRYWHGPGVGWSHPCSPDDPPEYKEQAKNNIAGYQENIEWLTTWDAKT